MDEFDAREKGWLEEEEPEHAVDLDTGVIVAAPIHPADEGDTTTLEAQKNLSAVGLAPTKEDPAFFLGTAEWLNF
jgi:hypothetical protein